jgi:hypothetical protein
MDWSWLAKNKDSVSLVMSGIAFVVAAGAHVVAFYTKTIDDRRQARATVNGLCLQIAELLTTLRVAQVEAIGTINLNAYNTRVASLTRQTATIAALARDIIKASQIKPVPIEYALIAEAIALNLDPSAEGLWREAVKSANTPSDQVDIFQRQGDYLFSLGRLQEGAVAHSAARAALGPNPNPFLVGRGFQLEAMGYANAREAGRARHFFDEAQRAYEAMPAGVQKDYALQSLAQARKTTLGET